MKQKFRKKKNLQVKTKNATKIPKGEKIFNLLKQILEKT